MTKPINTTFKHALFTGLFLTAAVASMPLHASPNIVLGVVQAQPGDTVNVPVTFNNNGDIAGIQFEVQYSDSQLSSGSAIATALLTSAGHTVLSSTPTAGTLRVLVPPNTAADAVNTGNVINLPFTVAGGAGGSHILTLNNVSLSRDNDWVSPSDKLINGIITDNVNGDTDGDGMRDSWEYANGLDATDPSDAGIDSDGDGVSNLDEYLAAAINTAPTAELSSVSLDEDTSHSFVAGEFGYTDIDGDALTAVRIDTLPSVGSLSYNSVAVTAGQEIGAASLNLLSYAADADANGVGYASFNFSVKDAEEWSAASSTMTLDVVTVNDAPVVSDASFNTDVDVAISSVLNGSDVDGDALTYRIITNGSLGTATITNPASGAFTYTPNILAIGVDNFTVVANDGLIDSNMATISINIGDADLDGVLNQNDHCANTAPTDPVDALGCSDAQKDYDYPYFTDFEVLESVHDDALDTDATNDVNGRADWLLEGDWGMAGDHGNWSSYSGMYHLDNNPGEIDQRGHAAGQLVTMIGYVDIPAESVVPVLSYRYKLNLLHDYDNMLVQVQVQGETTWNTLRTYKEKENHVNTHAFDTLSLESYKGQSIRIRFRQNNNSNAMGARLFVVDDLRIDALDASVADLDYPYFNDFESLTSHHDDVTDSNPDNDTNGQPDWSLQGDWALTGNHGNWTYYSGLYHLDNNPGEIDQRGHDVNQQATLMGYIEIPTESLSPALGYRYKLNLLHEYDYLYVEIQAKGEITWTVLKSYSRRENHVSTHASDTLSLASYKGQSVRIRFRQRNNQNASGARLFVLDDLWIDEYDSNVADYDYPYFNDFESLTSLHDDETDSNPSNDINGQADWNVQADWGMPSDHNDWTSYEGTYHLDNNANEIDQRGHNASQYATMMGYVEIPAESNFPALMYQYKLNLLHIYDYLYVEAQIQGSDTWVNLKAYRNSENKSDHYALETISLESYKGQSLRIRFRQSFNSIAVGARLFVVDNLRIDEFDVNVEDYDYPYFNDFESVTSLHDDATDNNPGNDINGQADWNLQADWGMAGNHNAWTNYQGVYHLDNNPNEIDQRGHNPNQLATMKGYIDIPAGAVSPIINYQYKLNLLHIYDYLYIEIQTQGTNSWAPLKTYRSTDNYDSSHILETISLEGYQGQSLRVRFRQNYNSNTAGARLFVVDDFGVGNDSNSDGVVD